MIGQIPHLLSRPSGHLQVGLSLIGAKFGQSYIYTIGYVSPLAGGTIDCWS